ncbi:MAG: GNAT family N-acetyltransferase [Anaerolineae bacterium]|nr:GNAT family N-acetyltransferase [Anaerolineae bacterium]
MYESRHEESFLIRPMREGEEPDVCALVCRVFDEHVAPLYPPEGITEFKHYVTPDHITARADNDHYVLLVFTQQELVGVIEMRRCEHVSLFFVETRYQSQGVGRRLMNKAIAVCRSQQRDIGSISVNSSLNAQSVYERLGFVAMEPIQTVHGISFVPMRLDLDDPRPR